jgi:hypothetical protein
VYILLQDNIAQDLYNNLTFILSFVQQGSSGASISDLGIPDIFLRDALYIFLNSILHTFLYMHHEADKGYHPYRPERFGLYLTFHKSLRVTSVLMGCYSNTSLLEPLDDDDNNVDSSPPL